MVFWLYFPFLYPQPKHKFAVLGCIEPKPLMLFIDTDINPYINNNDVRRAHHLVVAVADHAFLDYDSWLDCSDPVGYDLKALCAEVKKAPSTIRGRLSDGVKAQAIACIGSSALWPLAKATPFVNGLKACTPYEC